MPDADPDFRMDHGFAAIQKLDEFDDPAFEME
jgi:hypothetical protein